MNRIFPEDDPKRVNSILLDKWGISLFRFAQAFAVSPLDLLLQKPHYPVSLQEIRAARNSMTKVWTAIEDDACNFLSFMNKFGESSHRVFSKDDFCKQKAVFDFRTKYYIPRLWLLCVLEINHGARQGIGLSKKSIIALGWCNQIVNSGQKIDWTLLCDLYDWFWARVAPYDYYKEWDPGQGIEDYLKNQFHRYRWVGDQQRYLKKMASMDNSELFIFFFELSLNRWGQAKVKYPIDNLPITNKELPRFFRNFLIEAFLGRSEGISIFTSAGSLADPEFSVFNNWQRKAEQGDRRIPEDNVFFSLLEPFIKSWESFYKDTEVGCFIEYASSLYLNKRADLNNPPPLIIFPDKTYYSSAF